MSIIKYKSSTHIYSPNPFLPSIPTPIALICTPPILSVRLFVLFCFVSFRQPRKPGVLCPHITQVWSQPTHATSLKKE